MLRTALQYGNKERRDDVIGSVITWYSVALCIFQVVPAKFELLCPYEIAHPFPKLLLQYIRRGGDVDGIGYA